MIKIKSLESEVERLMENESRTESLPEGQQVSTQHGVYFLFVYERTLCMRVKFLFYISPIVTENCDESEQKNKKNLR